MALPTNKKESKKSLQLQNFNLHVKQASKQERESTRNTLYYGHIMITVTKTIRRRYLLMRRNPLAFRLRLVHCRCCVRQSSFLSLHILTFVGWPVSFFVVAARVSVDCVFVEPLQRKCETWHRRTWSTLPVWREIEDFDWYTDRNQRICQSLQQRKQNIVNFRNLWLFRIIRRSEILVRIKERVHA